jgi:hypothetical protein
MVEKNRWYSPLYTALIITAALIALWSCKKIYVYPPREGDLSIDCKTVDTFPDIPNLGFEDWTLSRTKRYWVPEPSCFWTTANQSADLIIGSIKPPVTTFKVGRDSAYAGEHALMLRSGTFRLFGLEVITSGTIAVGEFKPNPNDPLSSIRFGKPFTRRIKSVKGYYQAISVNSDSISMHCYMFRDNDTLGGAKIISNQTVRTWTPFELNLEYTSTARPNKLHLYFASSEAGKELKGQKGNTLMLDELSVEYY